MKPRVTLKLVWLTLAPSQKLVWLTGCLVWCKNLPISVLGSRSIRSTSSRGVGGNQLIHSNKGNMTLWLIWYNVHHETSDHLYPTLPNIYINTTAIIIQCIYSEVPIIRPSMVLLKSCLNSEQVSLKRHIYIEKMYFGTGTSGL